MGFNRLSGRISAPSFENNNITHLDILLGNMFSCQSIPNNDENSDFYICGSQDLNFSLLCLFSVVSSVFIVVVVWALFISPRFAYFKADFMSNLHNNAIKLWTYITYIDKSKLIYHNGNSQLQNIVAMIDDFKMVIFFSLKLLAVIIFMSVPIYIIRLTDDSNKYTTHAHSYTWVFTVAYMKGVLPATLIALSWIVVITLFFYHIMIRIKKSDISEEKQLLSIDDDQTSHKCNNKASENDSNNIQQSFTVLSFLLNITLSTTVNALYVWAITKQLSAEKLFIIQFSLAMFRLMYSQTALPILSRSIKDGSTKIIFQLRMLLLNNFLIPCIVVIFTSPSCFKDLIVQDHELSTPYEYQYCKLTDVTSSGNICVEYDVYQTSSAYLSPSFTYSNQCSSALLTSYIPVLIVGRTIHIIFCFVSPHILILMRRLIDVKKLVRMGFVSGIMWPELFVGNTNAEISYFDRNVFDESSLYLSILNSVLFMITFGLCSPMVAIALAFSLVFQGSIQLVLIGRFVSVVQSHSKDEEVSLLAFVAFSKSYVSLEDVLRQFFWPLAWSSSLFFSIFCWDIAGSGDEGFIETLWLPIMVLCYPSILFVVARCCNGKYLACLFQDCSTRELFASKERCESGVALSPVVPYSHS